MRTDTEGKEHHHNLAELPAADKKTCGTFNPFRGLDSNNCYPHKVYSNCKSIDPDNSQHNYCSFNLCKLFSYPPSYFRPFPQALRLVAHGADVFHDKLDDTIPVFADPSP